MHMDKAILKIPMFCGFNIDGECLGLYIIKKIKNIKM